MFGILGIILDLFKTFDCLPQKLSFAKLHTLRKIPKIDSLETYTIEECKYTIFPATFLSRIFAKQMTSQMVLFSKD